MTLLRANQIPALTGAKWPIASHPATLYRLKLADATMYMFMSILVWPWPYREISEATFLCKT